MCGRTCGQRGGGRDRLGEPRLGEALVREILPERGVVRAAQEDLLCLRAQRANRGERDLREVVRAQGLGDQVRHHTLLKPPGAT